MCLSFFITNLKESQWSKTNDVGIGPPDKKEGVSPLVRHGLEQTNRARRVHLKCVYLLICLIGYSVTGREWRSSKKNPCVYWVGLELHIVDDNEITGLTKWQQIQSSYDWEPPPLFGGCRLPSCCCCKCHRAPRLTCCPRPLGRARCPNSTSTIASRHQWKKIFYHDSHPATRMTLSQFRWAVGTRTKSSHASTAFFCAKSSAIGTLSWWICTSGCTK